MGAGTQGTLGLAEGRRRALANKNGRVLWAVMTRGERFDPHHISRKPGASTPN